MFLSHTLRAEGCVHGKTKAPGSLIFDLFMDLKFEKRHYHNHLISDEVSLATGTSGVKMSLVTCLKPSQIVPHVRCLNFVKI